MSKPKAFLVTWDSVKMDSVFEPGKRGARKLLVTELYEDKEEQATDPIWKHSGEHERSQVWLMKDTEVAVFNNYASQDSHYHRDGTEIYEVIEGKMMIEVEREVYELGHGDMIVVPPFSRHKVLGEKTEFLCRVVSVNCGGKRDKHLN